MGQLTLPVVRPWRLALRLPATLPTGGARPLYDLTLTAANAAALASAGFTFTRASAAWSLEGVQVATDVPRLDSRGLWIEGARSNLCLRSQTLSDAAWTKTTSSITADAVVAPDGATTGDTYVEAGVSSHLRPTASITTVASTTYTYSFYAKRSNCDWFRILVADNSGLATNVARAWFNLNSGVAGTSSVAGAGFTSPSTAIVAIGSGWHRCSLTFTTSVTSIWPAVQTADADASTTRANVGGGAGIGGEVHLWQGQVEAGGFASSPIVTAGSTVTRAVDLCVATRAAATLAQGTVAVEVVAAGWVSGTSNVFWQADDGTSNNRIILLRPGATGAVQQFVSAATIGQVSGGSLIPAEGTTFKSAMRWQTNNCAISSNGGTPSLDTSATMPSVTVERLGSGVAAVSPAFTYLRRIRRFATPVSITELQALSA
jgi:hypothetical protein